MVRISEGKAKFIWAFQSESTFGVARGSAIYSLVAVNPWIRKHRIHDSRLHDSYLTFVPSTKGRDQRITNWYICHCRPSVWTKEENLVCNLSSKDRFLPSPASWRKNNLHEYANDGFCHHPDAYNCIGHDLGCKNQATRLKAKRICAFCLEYPKEQGLLSWGN